MRKLDRPLFELLALQIKVAGGVLGVVLNVLDDLILVLLNDSRLGTLREF